MDSIFTIGKVGFLISGVVYLFLLAVYFLSFYKGSFSKQFLLLLVANIIWSFLLFISQFGASIPIEMAIATDILRAYTWIYILQTALGIYKDKAFWFATWNPLSRINLLALFLLALLLLSLNENISNLFQLESSVIVPVFMFFIFIIIGLLFVELVFRNTNREHRHAVLYLCISAGSIFIYDLFVFSNALLLQKIDYEFWSFRGYINVMIAPALAIAAVRNPTLAPELHLSRQFVFHSTTLIGAGIYLFMMSLAGYYIKESSGEWGKILQILFLFAALALFFILFLSSSIKLRIKRYLNTSFRNKYDYRIEWNRFSQTLLKPESEISIYDRVLQAIAQVVDSQGATLWLKDGNNYVLKTVWNSGFTRPEYESENSILLKFLHDKKSIIDVDEMRRKYSGKQDVEHWFLVNADSWVIVPLWLENTLYGFIHLNEPELGLNLDFEDIDLIDTLAHHIAISLFSKKVDDELQNSQQFEKLNQLVAFLVHDLKTVLSQLNLMVENSEQHKSNPAFVEDMIATVKHATNKMQRLIKQIQNPDSDKNNELIPIDEFFEEIVTHFNHSKTIPRLTNKLQKNASVSCNRETLKSAFMHIVQNAIDSIIHEGKVEIILDHYGESELKITIVDTGEGMTREFITEKLFKPFESTKGVSGMGVGVYQSRETIRSVGGDIYVKSEPGNGSEFTIMLPASYE